MFDSKFHLLKNCIDFQLHYCKKGNMKVADVIFMFPWDLNFTSFAIGSLSLIVHLNFVLQ